MTSTTTGEGLRVVQLRISSFKGITVADITPPEKGVVVVSGKNGAGKSSLMDSIAATLGGGPENRRIAQPVKRGNTRSQVVVDLGDLTVSRQWDSEGNSWLTVTGADGRERRSPQRLLNSLLGKLSFDPGAFLNQSPAQQRDMLLQATGLSEVVTDIDRSKKAISDERRLLRREIKTVQSRLDTLPAPSEDVPLEEVTASDLVERIQRNTLHNQRIMHARRRKSELTTSIEETRRRIAELQSSLELQQFELGEVEQTAEEETVDVSDLESQVSRIDQINAQVRTARQWRELAEQLTEKTAQESEYTTQLDQLDKQKSHALAQADLPVPGLGIDDEGITYQGVPFQDANTASRLRTATAIAMALNPTIRIIRISDGSLLDRENLAAINDLASDKGYQVWVERVDDDEDASEGIVIREGAVVSNQYQE